MITILTELFTTWEFRPEVLVIPLLFAFLYLVGWVRLYRITNRHRLARRTAVSAPEGKGIKRDERRLAEPWRLVIYMVALGLLLVALLSGLDAYASLLFSVHMVQHLLIIMIIAPMIWLANPYPFILWGLPRSLRLRMSRLFSRPSAFRQGLSAVTNAGVAWIFLVAVTWIWHDSNLYDATLRSSFLHDVEHITFFVAAMIFWWHVIGLGPYIHKPMGYLKRTGFVIAMMPVTMALGAFIAFAPQPLYQYYTTVPRVWNLSVMEDQMIGGVIMWVPGTMMYLVAALALGAMYLRIEEQKAPLPISHWASDEALRVPGMESENAPHANTSEHG